MRILRLPELPRTHVVSFDFEAGQWVELCSNNGHYNTTTKISREAVALKRLHPDHSPQDGRHWTGVTCAACRRFYHNGRGAAKTVGIDGINRLCRAIFGDPGPLGWG